MAQLLECGPLSFPGDTVRGLYGDVSVAFDEGELTVLEGESGGGKSTLLRQIAGLAPSDGPVRRLGCREFAPNDMAAWRAEVTLLMQDAPLLPATVERNLAFPFSLAVAYQIVVMFMIAAANALGSMIIVVVASNRLVSTNGRLRIEGLSS